MTDNRRIDRLIAEYVMGLRIYHYDKDHADSCYYMLVDENCDYAGDEFGRHAGERDSEADAWEKDCPYYSTDISAAWEVVDRLFFQGIELIIAPYSCGRVCEVEARQHGCEMEGTLSRDASAPLAICLAALKSKGIDV